MKIPPKSFHSIAANTPTLSGVHDTKQQDAEAAYNLICNTMHKEIENLTPGINFKKVMDIFISQQQSPNSTNPRDLNKQELQFLNKLKQNSQLGEHMQVVCSHRHPHLFPPGPTKSAELLQNALQNYVNNMTEKTMQEIISIVNTYSKDLDPELQQSLVRGCREIVLSGPLLGPDFDYNEHINKLQVAKCTPKEHQQVTTRLKELSKEINHKVIQLHNMDPKAIETLSTRMKTAYPKPPKPLPEIVTKAVQHVPEKNKVATSVNTAPVVGAPVGFPRLGNTCYLASSLQTILNHPTLLNRMSQHPRLGKAFQRFVDSNKTADDSKNLLQAVMKEVSHQGLQDDVASTLETLTGIFMCSDSINYNQERSTLVNGLLSVTTEDELTKWLEHKYTNILPSNDEPQKLYSNLHHLLSYIKFIPTDTMSADHPHDLIDIFYDNERLTKLNSEGMIEALMLSESKKILNFINSGKMKKLLNELVNNNMIITNVEYTLDSQLLLKQETLKNLNNNNLSGITVHIGDQHSGHYIAYVCRDDKIYQCNDNQVSECTNFKEVIENMQDPMRIATILTKDLQGSPLLNNSQVGLPVRN